jgi:hypothetical protein
MVEECSLILHNHVTPPAAAVGVGDVAEVEEEVEEVFVVAEGVVGAGVDSINHPGQPRTKDLSKNTKERKPRSVMMSNLVISHHHVTCKPRTTHNTVKKLLCILERMVR